MVEKQFSSFYIIIIITIARPKFYYPQLLATMPSNSILFSIALALLCIVSLSHGEEWEGRLALEPNGNDWIEGASLVLKPNSKTHKFPEHAALQVSSTIFNATSSKSLPFSVENQQIATLGKTAIDSPKGSVDSSALEHDGYTFAHELSPCHFTGVREFLISLLPSSVHFLREFLFHSPFLCFSHSLVNILQ